MEKQKSFVVSKKESDVFPGLELTNLTLTDTDPTQYILLTAKNEIETSELNILLEMENEEYRALSIWILFMCKGFAECANLFFKRFKHILSPFSFISLSKMTLANAASIRSSSYHQPLTSLTEFINELLRLVLPRITKKICKFLALTIFDLPPEIVRGYLTLDGLPILDSFIRYDSRKLSKEEEELEKEIIFKILDNFVTEKEGYKNGIGIIVRGLRHCQTIGLRNVAQFIASFSKRVWNQPIIMELVMENKLYKYVISEVKEGNVRMKDILESDMLSVVLEDFKNPKFFTRVIEFLFHIKDISLHQILQEKLCYTFERLLADPEFEENISNVLCPLVTYLQLSFIFRRLAINNSCFYSGFNNQAIQMRDKSKELHDLIADINIIEAIYWNIYYPFPRNTIDHLFKEKFFFADILSTSTIEKSTYFKWNSGLYDYRIMAASTAWNRIFSKSSVIKIGSDEAEQSENQPKRDTKILVSSKTLFMTFRNKMDSKQDTSLDTICPPSNELSEIDTKPHFYQFFFFKNSIFLRRMYEFAFLIAVIIIAFNKIIEFILKASILPSLNWDVFAEVFNLQNSPDLVKTTLLACLKDTACGTSYNTLTTQEDKICLLATRVNNAKYSDQFSNCQTLLNTANDIVPTYSALWPYLTLVCLLFTTPLYRILYGIFVRKKVRLEKNQIFYWIAIIAAFLFLLNTIDVIQPPIADNDAQGQVNFIYYYTLIMGSLTSVFLWMSLIEYLQDIKKLGLLIEIISLNVKDLAGFLVILVVHLLTFSSLLSLSFGPIYKDFENFFVTFRNIFGYGLGNFKFFDTSSNANIIASSIIIAIFLVITNIVLFNLLIAILANTFSKFMTFSSMEYSLLMLKSFKRYRYVRSVGAMMMLPAPLSIVTLPISLVQMILRDEGLNEVLSNIYYLPFLTLYFVLFLAFNLMTIPFAYLNILFSIPSNQELNTKAKTRFFFKWLAFGFFYLLWILVKHDIRLFFVSAYKKPEKIKPTVHRMMYKENIKGIKVLLKNGELENFESRVRGSEAERIFTGFMSTLEFLKQRKLNYLLLWQLLHVKVKLGILQEIMAYLK